MKIRCKECRKKVSIDDAFAGGVCRCPYCTAIVPVPGRRRMPAPGARPEAPTQRPAAPAPAAGEQPLAAPEHVAAPAEPERHIPVAMPVKVQGVFAIALLGVLAAMVIAVAVLLVVELLGKGGNDGSLREPANPFLANTSMPAVAGDVRIKPPVIYVVPVSRSMGEVFDYASKMVLASVGSLGDGEFSIVLCGQDGDQFLVGGYARATKAGRDAAEKFLTGAQCRGVSDVPRAMKAAWEKNPKTIVLLWRGAADGMADLAAEAKQKKVRIVTVALDASESDCQSQAAFAQAAGGKSVSYTRGGLAYWYSLIPTEP